MYFHPSTSNNSFLHNSDMSHQVYIPASYAGNPFQNSPEEKKAYENIQAALVSIGAGITCTCCHTSIGAYPEQVPPSLVIYCNCGDLVVLFDQNTTLADVHNAIVTRFDPVEQDVVGEDSPRFACYDEHW